MQVQPYKSTHTTFFYKIKQPCPA